MSHRSVATVFGGSGFLGGYLVKRLAAQGHVVRVAARDPDRAGALRPLGQVGQIVPLYANLEHEATIARAVEGASLVVNLVGILAERRAGDFQRIHADGAGRIARAARAAGVPALAHVSANGAAHDSPSAYARSKAEGEDQLRDAFPEAAILRPSLVFGAEDQFFNRFGQLALISPIMPVIEGETRFQPVYVGDVADAIMAALTRIRAGEPGTTWCLTGPDVRSFREILAWILEQTGRRRPLVRLPDGLVRLMARIPFSGLTNDQLLLLKQDNVADLSLPNLAALDIVPTPIDLVVPGYLAQYRVPGRRRPVA